MSNGPGEGTSGDDVGSVGEEAAKLLGALSDWARDHGGDLGAGDGPGGVAAQAAAAVREVVDHVDTGAAECAWCPLCRAVHVVRDPQVRDHLANAAASLMQAAAGILAATASHERRPPAPGVERIDLDDDGPWPEEER